ncbi:MAG: flagellar motor protein MotB [Desulfovibrionaceae bacterium]
MRPQAPFTRKRPETDDSGWSLTFADMMTLLLCFFVLLVTVARVDESKYETMSSVMARAMGGDAAARKAPASPEPQPGAVTAPVRPESMNLFELQLELASLVGEARGEVDLKMRSDPHAVAISLGEAILFDLGRAELKPGARQLLARLAGPLAGADYDLLIEGHTDDLPIHSAQFPSNWELSSARASAVARLFIERGVDKSRITVMGMADTDSVAKNATDQGRAKNRRVVVLVKPD